MEFLFGIQLVGVLFALIGFAYSTLCRRHDRL